MIEELVEKSVNFFNVGDYSNALLYNEKAIEFANRRKKLPNAILETIYANKGYTLMAMEEYEKAILQFKRANSFLSNAENLWSQFLCYANMGHFDTAIPYHFARYGATRKSPTRVQFPDLPIQQAKSISDLANKRVLILNEQGLGDEILFFSGINKLSHVFTSASLQCYPETIRLLSSQVQQKVTCFFERSFSLEFIQQFDVWTTTGDMFIFSNEVSTLGYTTGFLEVQENSEPNGVGFCWKANAQSPNAHKRSINTEQLRVFAEDRNVSLQFKSECPEWMELMPEVSDLLDTAIIMKGLKKIVTVDTSIAHLAGSLGLPTTLIINKHWDWRWKYVSENNYSKFYPTIKLEFIKD